jgi:predicted metalloprotease with PDZ domain
MITYRIHIADAHAHQFRVTLTVPEPQAEQRLSMPVWIPGSYLVREFARHVSGLQARQGRRTVPVRKLDKATWQAGCTGRSTLTVSYLVYAFDTSVRAAFLDADRAFFNGTSLCLRVEGFEAQPHRLELGAMPKGWQVATALAPRRRAGSAGRGGFVAADYDELADQPVELGPFWRGGFVAGGVGHEFVVAGALPDFDGERLLADARRICEATIGFWRGKGVVRGKAPGKGVAGLPFERYVFLLNAVDEGRGGLEHRASAALIAPRRDLPRRGVAECSDGYVDLLGLISHEYFHAWNVKRLRPAEFARYDYTRENYTDLLWLFEGFTSYYDDLLLFRSGLIDEERYLRLLAKTVTGVLATPGRRMQSVAQSSFDAWVKYYRADENTPNATVSYYTKGALVALALDLTLRAQGSGSLDEVMRLLWRQSRGGPVGEPDVAAALQAVAGRSMGTELSEWVHGTVDLPLRRLLAAAGVTWQHQTATLAQRLGMRVSESALTGVKVSHVLSGGPAQRAGLSAGDEILAVDGWRLRRLDEALRPMVPARRSKWLVSRDQRVLSLSLDVPKDDKAAGPVALGIDAKAPKAALALRKTWLSG